MPQVEVCLSPALIDNFDLPGKTAVVADIIRATTIICAAIENGIEHVLPVPSKDETLQMKRKGYLIMGEKDGERINGFDLSNSAKYFFSRKYAGQKLAMSTTNGTKTIHMASIANQLLIGAFLNIGGLAQYLTCAQEDVVLICAGWKDKVNTEDTLFAGMLSTMLEKNGFEINSDAAKIAQLLYKKHKNNMYAAIMQSSQRERIQNHGLEEDVRFSLTLNYSRIVPVLSNGLLVPLNWDYVTPFQTQTVR